MLISRAFQGLARAWLVLAVVLSACGGQEALVLSLRTPPGTAIKSYAIEVQDRGNRKLVYYSGIKTLKTPRDLSEEPLKYGLQFDQNGAFLIHVRAARIA